MNSTKVFWTNIGLKSGEHYTYQLIEIGYNKTENIHSNLNATPENGLNPRPRFEATYSQRD